MYVALVTAYNEYARFIIKLEAANKMEIHIFNFNSR